MTEFSIKNDLEIINQGGFWCSACLSGKPISEKSADSRYCLPCYNFLKDGNTPLPEPPVKPVIQATTCNKIQINDKIPPRRKKTSNTLEGKDKIPDKRGRKKLDLPMNISNKLSGKGMSSRDISKTLRIYHGIEVSHMTIARAVKWS